MFLRINDTIIELSGAKIDLSGTSYDGRPAFTIETPLGKNYCFTDDAAEALKTYFETLGDTGELVDLDKMFKKSAEPKTERGHGSGPLPGRDVTVVQTGEKTKFIQPAYPVLYSPSRCPLKDWHAEQAVPCPACGRKPGQAASDGPGGPQTTSET